MSRRVQLFARLFGLGLSFLPLQSAHGEAAYTVTPAFQTITLDAHGNADLSIDLANHTANDQSFQLSVADFGTLNESGGVAFLGTPARELDHPYGLVSWLQLDQNVVFVPAGKVVTLKASVENRDSLAPGGHYGAILATAVTDSGKFKSVSPQVGLRAVLSSLILVTKSGGAAPELNLLSEDSTHNLFALPSTLDQRFQDAGNVHVVPRGTTTIRDPFGKVVSSGALNEDSVFVFPESFRRIRVNLSELAQAFVPGRYSVTTIYRYDGTEGTKTFIDHVWYAGAILVWLSWSMIAGVLIAAIWWWLRRRNKISHRAR
jgi:hypothetical protein